MMPSEETMQDLVKRGFRAEGYRLPYWVDMSDAMTPKEMAQAEKKWIKENPEKAKEWENKDALKDRLKESPARMSPGGARGSGGGSGAGVDIEGLPKRLKGGPKNFKAGGKVASASKRADGIAQRGKTKGRYI